MSSPAVLPLPLCPPPAVLPRCPPPLSSPADLPLCPPPLSSPYVLPRCPPPDVLLSHIVDVYLFPRRTYLIVNNEICANSSRRESAKVLCFAGDFANSIETLVTAISLIKRSRICKDTSSKILITSLQDTLHGIENKSYGGRLAYVVFFDGVPPPLSYVELISTSPQFRLRLVSLEL